MPTVILLLISNIFMTFAWYGHLKNQQGSIYLAVITSWGIAFFEYCFMVPANRLGALHGYSTPQLKVIQEVITLTVFCVFTALYLKESLHWNHAVGFTFVAVGAFFIFKPW